MTVIATLRNQIRVISWLALAPMAFGRARWGHPPGGRAETPVVTNDHLRSEVKPSEVFEKKS